MGEGGDVPTDLLPAGGACETVGGVTVEPPDYPTTPGGAQLAGLINLD